MRDEGCRGVQYIGYSTNRSTPSYSRNVVRQAGRQAGRQTRAIGMSRGSSPSVLKIMRRAGSYRHSGVSYVCMTFDPFQRKTGNKRDVCARYTLLFGSSHACKHEQRIACMHAHYTCAVAAVSGYGNGAVTD